MMGPDMLTVLGQEEARNSTPGYGEIHRITWEVGCPGTAVKPGLSICVRLEPSNPDNLLTWITHLTVAADQATPTNRLAALPKGNWY